MEKSKKAGVIKSGAIKSAALTDNHRAQGLPMSTIVIIILVALVLLVVGFIFLTYFMGGATGIDVGTNATKLGIGNLTEAASGAVKAESCKGPDNPCKDRTKDWCTILKGYGCSWG